MAEILKRKTIETKSRVLRGTQLEYDDLARQATDYLEEVQRQADAILAEAHEEAATIREEARVAGRAAAERDAEVAARERVDLQLGSLLPAVRSTVSSLQEMRHQWLAQWEANVLQLATKIAETTIRRELSQDLDVTRTWIREALELAAGCHEIRLRLHPHDYELLQNQTTNLAKEFQQLAATQIVADPQVSPGGCCLDTDFGVIDQQLETQLARIQAELT